METLFGDVEFYRRTNAHADAPGTGPVDQTCGTCAYYARVKYHDKVYRKCGLMREYWTHGPGTDIRAKDHACVWWKQRSAETKGANMKRVTQITGILLMSALCFAQTCPEQEFANPQMCPFGVDPNQIAIDPASGQRLLLDCVACDVGREMSYDGWACDPDGNPMIFAVTRGVLANPTPDTYTLRYTPTTVGLTYIHISVSDVPPVHQESLTRTGTLVILATRANQPPVLCGGRP